MTREEFWALAGQGVVLLDGATGSNLRRAGLPVGVSPERWILEHPAILLELQRGYVDAGSQILYAPTFGSNRVSQLYDIYREQVAALAEAGVDLLVAETMMGVEETAAALDAARSVCDLAVLCSLSVEADGSALFDGSAAEAVVTLQEMGAAAVGVNCSVGPDQLEAVVAGMRAVAEVPVIAKPNAGMPVMTETGEALYSMGPEDFARHMRTLVDAGAGVVGGCCGTTPDYIRQDRAALGR